MAAIHSGKPFALAGHGRTRTGILRHCSLWQATFCVLGVFIGGCGGVERPEMAGAPDQGTTPQVTQNAHPTQGSPISEGPGTSDSSAPQEQPQSGRWEPSQAVPTAPGDSAPSTGPDIPSVTGPRSPTNSIEPPPNRVPHISKAAPMPVEPVAPGPAHMPAELPTHASSSNQPRGARLERANPLRPGERIGGARGELPEESPLNPLRSVAPGDDFPEAGLPVFAMEAEPDEAMEEAPPDDLLEAADEASGQESDYTVVKVFYGTDRKPVDSDEADARGLSWLAISVVVLIAGCTYLVWSLFVGHMRGALLGAGITLVAGCATAVLLVQTLPLPLAAEPDGAGIQRRYGNDRGSVELGVCRVSIPRDHRMGKIERPSVFRLEFREDPQRHVVILSVKPQPADEFFAQLRETIDDSKLRQAFVFVHGFNVTFDDAARRTAQLAYDLQFDGALIFFSWPSQGGLLQYAVDETNVTWAVPHLKQFLLDVAEQSQAEQVHLIAHSMGNRALTAALQALAYEMRDRLPLFNEVVLTAPDIDAEVFQRDIVPAIIPTAQRITLYASSNDEALKLSKQIHGYRRAGDSGAELLVVPGIDTVDVSAVDTSLIGHAYYGDNRTVLADLWDLIRESKPPQMRPWLRPAWFGQFVYWVFHRDDVPAVPERQPAPVPEL